MKRLSGFDAWLLYSETPTGHQHTLKAAVLSPTPGHPFDLDHLRARFARRMHLLEPFRYVLAEVPFGLHHPMWRENSPVDLDYHLRPVQLAAPGGRRELDDLLGRILAEQLDRTRPLWELHVITGLADGRVVLAMKMHHALADGVASGNLLGRSVEDYPDEALAEYQPVPPDPAPSRREVLRWALADHAHQLRALPGLVSRTVRGVRRLLRHAPESPPDSGNVLKPPRIFLNGAISADRRFTTVALPLDGVREIRTELGMTVNEVLIALAAGAVRHLMLEVTGAADQPLTASQPIGTDSDPTRISGNKIMGMFVSLPVHLADPVHRARSSAAATRVAREQARLLGHELMNAWTEYLPPRPFAAYARYASRRGLADRATARMSVVVSTVPGPKEQILVAGYPVSEFWSVGPLYEGCGVNITIWSYRDRLHVSVLCDPAMLPDPTVLTDGFQRAFDELRDAVFSGRSAASPAPSPAPSPAEPGGSGPS